MADQRRCAQAARRACRAIPETVVRGNSCSRANQPGRLRMHHAWGHAMNAMIKIDDQTVGLWSAHLAPKVDFFACMNRAPDGTFVTSMRIRTVVDDLIFEASKDSKTWYQV